jgi:hypothetical protein
MSRIFYYCLFSNLTPCGVWFCLLFVFLIFGRYYIDAAIYDNLQDLIEDHEQQLVRN